jgi:hypothetical protein
MASGRSEVVAEPRGRWSTVPAVDHGRTPRHDRLPMEHIDAIARPATWARPSVAA